MFAEIFSWTIKSITILVWFESRSVIISLGPVVQLKVPLAWIKSRIWRCQKRLRSLARFCSCHSSCNKEGAGI